MTPSRRSASSRSSASSGVLEGGLRVLARARGPRRNRGGRSSRRTGTLTPVAPRGSRGAAAVSESGSTRIRRRPTTSTGLTLANRRRPAAPSEESPSLKQGMTTATRRPYSSVMPTKRSRSGGPHRPCPRGARAHTGGGAKISCTMRRPAAVRAPLIRTEQVEQQQEREHEALKEDEGARVRHGAQLHGSPSASGLVTRAAKRTRMTNRCRDPREPE
jgi:hypothetical protein